MTISAISQDTRPEQAELNRELTRITKVDLAAISQERHGAYTFEFLARTLSNIAELFGQLQQGMLNLLPNNRLTELTMLARRYMEIIHRIEIFSAADDKGKEINEIQKSIDQLHSDCLDPITSAMAVSLAQLQAYFGKQQEAVEARIKQLTDNADAKLQMINQSEQDANDILQGIKAIAKEAGVVEHTTHFSNQAKEHKRAAWIWLCASIILAITTLYFAWYSYTHYVTVMETLTVPQSVQLALNKLVVLSVLISGLLWCGKSYRAQQHNYVINKHRQNALSTFQTFSQATTDEQTKNAVLLQATQCIFSQQPSGYIMQESDTANHPQVLEIIRSITGTQSKP